MRVVPIDECHEDWEAMEERAGGRRRFCESCSKCVHDLSALDEGEARAFLETHRGQDVCISYEVAADDPERITFNARRAPALIAAHRLLRRSAPAMARATMAVALAACTPHAPPEQMPERAPAPVAKPDTPLRVAAEAPPAPTPPHQVDVGSADVPCESEAPPPSTRPEKKIRRKGGKRRPMTDRKKGGMIAADDDLF